MSNASFELQNAKMLLSETIEVMKTAVNDHLHEYMEIFLGDGLMLDRNSERAFKSKITNLSAIQGN